LSNPFLTNPSIVAIIKVERFTGLELVESSEIETTRVFFRFTNCGHYITKVEDVLKKMTFKPNLILEYETTSQSSLSIYIRTSDDNITWSQWQTYDSAQNYTCRYFQFKLEMINESVFKFPTVTAFSYSVSIPNIVKSGDISVELGGSIVSYGFTYPVLPMLVISPLDDELKYEIVYRSKTKFKVKLFNKITNAETTGQINWLSSGMEE